MAAIAALVAHTPLCSKTAGAAGDTPEQKQDLRVIQLHRQVRRAEFIMRLNVAQQQGAAGDAVVGASQTAPCVGPQHHRVLRAGLQVGSIRTQAGKHCVLYIAEMRWRPPSSMQKVADVSWSLSEEGTEAASKMNTQRMLVHSGIPTERPRHAHGPGRWTHLQIPDADVIDGELNHHSLRMGGCGCQRCLQSSVQQLQAEELLLLDQHCQIHSHHASMYLQACICLWWDDGACTS